MSKKRSRGQYFTVGNPFGLRVFRRWADKAGLRDGCLLEPFAGANHIVDALRDMELCNAFASFDIDPQNKYVRKRDTIKNFPKDFDVCITNPPWLARNSATRRGLPYPVSEYDDLYKHCLSLCLDNCAYVAAIIPASFLQTGLFQRRLSSYTLLHKILFEDTENPVCLALFAAKENARVDLYYDDTRIGTLKKMHAALPKPKHDRSVRFNDPQGQLGFISFDDTEKPTIRFCEVGEIAGHEIKVSSRFITRISGDFSMATSKLINRLNRSIATFRNDTRDVFLTPFKGMRKDGYYRRRMEFALARGFINAV